MEESDAKPRIVRSATIIHDGEEWSAVVGRTLSGHDRDGRPLRSSATVLAIVPNSRLLITDGKGGQWHTEAMVHEIRDVKYEPEDSLED